MPRSSRLHAWIVYETTSALSYYRCARETLMPWWNAFDTESGGFFDVEQNTVELLGVLEYSAESIAGFIDLGGKPRSGDCAHAFVFSDS